MMHADPHPGNFIIDEKNDLGVIDFGCIKHIPDDFYRAYFELASHEVLNDKKRTDELFKELEIIRPDDPKKDVAIISKMFTELIWLLSRPINEGMFDFSNEAYFNEIYAKGDQISKDPEMNRLQARGSRHFVYFNRTFFGLFNILHSLKAKVDCSTVDFVKLAS